MSNYGIKYILCRAEHDASLCFCFTVVTRVINESLPWMWFGRVKVLLHGTRDALHAETRVGVQWSAAAQCKVQALCCAQLGSSCGHSGQRSKGQQMWMLTAVYCSDCLCSQQKGSIPFSWSAGRMVKCMKSLYLVPKVNKLYRCWLHSVVITYLPHK